MRTVMKYLGMFLLTLGLTSCEPKESLSEDQAGLEASMEQEKPNKTIHSYGGWYCPDNLTGFPPVNLAEIDQLKVVSGRLPTREEASNGSSLMYFDPAEFPEAKALDMSFPRLARFYLEHTGKWELVIVIQGVVVEQDTVVGFRYLNGGNGSSWFSEVEFLSEDEVSELGSTPFVFLESDIQAKREVVYQAILKSEYAQYLEEFFDETGIEGSVWGPGNVIRLERSDDGVEARGIIMELFGSLYFQMDYDFDGNHQVEKLLILPDDDQNASRLQIVIGPINEGYESKLAYWQEWMEDIRISSEG